MTWNIPTESFISAQHSYVPRRFIYDIGSWHQSYPLNIFENFGEVLIFYKNYFFAITTDPESNSERLLDLADPILRDVDGHGRRRRRRDEHVKVRNKQLHFDAGRSGQGQTEERSKSNFNYNLCL